MPEDAAQCASSCIDEVKKFWNSRPCNIRHSRAHIGTLEYFDQVEARKFMVEPHILEFSEFEAWQGKNVLEIGCGIGTAAIRFARAGAHYSGMELPDESLDLTAKRFDVYGLKGNLYCERAEDRSLVLPVEEYDLVYPFGVTHHSPHPEGIVSEVRNTWGGGRNFA